MEKMTISFWIWGIFDDGTTYHNLDARMKELKARGFNTIRVESGAGLYCDSHGNPRGEVKLMRPFGELGQRIRQTDAIANDFTFDAPTRLVEFFEAADRADIKVILSGWYYLHTNWFCDETINNELFALSTEQKIRYFTDELDRILSILDRNHLTQCVAFAELLNEFDGLDFAGGYGRNLPEDQAHELRRLHEESIASLKNAHPDVKFAYDTYSPNPYPELIPRNIDVLNFHSYYLWELYNVFQKNIVTCDETEPKYPPETLAYLMKKPVTVKDVIKARRNNLRTGKDWTRRVALYNSIDPDKIPELERLLNRELSEKYRFYLNKLRNAVKSAKAVRDAVVPNAALVMGEGVTYCCSNLLLFEEHSDRYWDLLLDTMVILREEGLDGTVVRTTSGPEDPSWLMRVHEYKILNAEFLRKCEII